MKDIKMLYKDIKVLSNGEIECNKKKSIIYQVVPITVLDNSEGIKNKIYSVYYPFIKGMPNEFKIIVLKEKLDIESNINKLKQRASKVNSLQLKNAILTYVSNLRSLIEANVTLIDSYYLVVPSGENLKDRFEILQRIGISFRKVEQIDEIKKIFRKGMALKFL